LKTCGENFSNAPYCVTPFSTVTVTAKKGKKNVKTKKRAKSYNKIALVKLFYKPIGFRVPFWLCHFAFLEFASIGVAKSPRRLAEKVPMCPHFSLETWSHAADKL